MQERHPEEALLNIPKPRPRSRLRDVSA